MYIKSRARFIENALNEVLPEKARDFRLMMNFYDDFTSFLSWIRKVRRTPLTPESIAIYLDLEPLVSKEPLRILAGKYIGYAAKYPQEERIRKICELFSESLAPLHKIILHSAGIMPSVPATDSISNLEGDADSDQRWLFPKWGNKDKWPIV